MTIPFTDHARPPGAARLLVAVHGDEADTWTADAARAVALWGAPSLRILAVLAVPRASFSSLVPAAARRYHAAREAWRELETQRLRPVIDRLRARLAGAGEVVWVTAERGDPGRAIAEHAAEWGADAVVVGAAPPPVPWLGAIHERLVRHAACPVLVVPAAVVASPRARVPASARARAHGVPAGLGA